MTYIVTAEAARRIDRDAMDIRGVSGRELMLKAGTALADAVLEVCRKHKLSAVQIFCGSGNNGGDGFVSAGILKKRDGLDVDVFYFGNPDIFSADSLFHFNKMRDAGIMPQKIADTKSLKKMLRTSACWVDAIFGTGLNRPLYGFLLDVLRLLHDKHRNQPLIAADIPSGIHGGNGRLMGPALKADTCVCMGFYKSGNFLHEGKFYSGKLRLAELDYPRESFEHALPQILLCDHKLVRKRLKALSPTQHKYSAGQVLLLAASAAMPGAVTLASQAALRGGAGMLRALLPEKAIPVVLAHLPEAVLMSGSDPNLLNVKDLPQLRALMEEKSRVLLAGPGYGRDAGGAVLLKQMIKETQLPLVLDADALFHLTPQDLKNCPAPCVITPHAGEFAKFTGLSVDDVLDAPIELALKLALETGTVVHLKGSTSLTALPSASVYLHTGGAPGMATAGSGDLLAGLIASLIAQGHSCEDAALIAAFYHREAGQAAAEALGNRSMIASDILNFLPKVLKNDEVLA